MRTKKPRTKIAKGLFTLILLSGFVFASPAIYHSMMRSILQERVQKALYNCNIHCTSDTHARALAPLTLEQRSTDKCMENECPDLAMAMTELAEFDRRW